MQLAIENIRCMSSETLSSSIIYHHDLELLDTKSNWMSLQAAQQRRITPSTSVKHTNKKKSWSSFSDSTVRIYDPLI